MDNIYNEQQQTITEDACLAAIAGVKQFLNEQIIGQQHLIDGLLMALLADGHILVEGPPGLLKPAQSKCWPAVSKVIFIASSLPRIFYQQT